MDRRRFLTQSAASFAGATLLRGNLLSQAAGALNAHGPATPFSFIFFTDTHLEPELNAAKGCDMAFRHMRSVRNADFAIQGGDHVFDTLAVPKDRSLALWDLYEKTQQDLSLKVYHTVGNHDVMGLKIASGMSPDDPLYGKKYFRDHFGKTYYSFDHKGVHFIVLDSVQAADRDYEGRVDAKQLQWLRTDLAALAPQAPVLVVTHIPLVTSADAYLPRDLKPHPHFQLSVVNSSEVISLFAGHNVLAVLQGHTHINEVVTWHSVLYITSGAVSGNWWKGTRLGTPEGYTVVDVGPRGVETHYETYGFQSVAPQNT